eukprot:scaffold36972_cov27-Prasinocladus_malaysianus.AAC.2
MEGIDIDILESFAARLGLKVRYLKHKDFYMVWEMPGTWLTSKGSADVACGGIGPAKWRLESPNLEWTLPYFKVLRTVVFNKAAPISNFPKDVNGVIVGAMGSTGFLDAYMRLQKFKKEEFLENSHDDKEDLRRLLAGEIQGIMRGSSVGKRLVRQNQKHLAMLEPWSADDDTGDNFCFVTRAGVGLDMLLSAYILELQGNKKEWNTPLKKHGLD